VDHITYHLVAFNYMNGNLATAAAAAPLSAVLMLLATGLGALGVLGWRGKPKTQAAA
jgi:hypothetical protein